MNNITITNLNNIIRDYAIKLETLKEENLNLKNKIKILKDDKKR